MAVSFIDRETAVFGEKCLGLCISQLRFVLQCVTY